MPFLGREIVCGVAGDMGDARVCAVRRLTCASSLFLCFRMSSSLSFMENASSMNASGLGGRTLGGGRDSASSTASGDADCRKTRRAQENIAKPARNRNVTPRVCMRSQPMAYTRNVWTNLRTRTRPTNGRDTQMEGRQRRQS